MIEFFSPICSLCNDTGLLQIICDNCRGSGAKERFCIESQDYKTVICEECGGGGVLDKMCFCQESLD